MNVYQLASHQPVSRQRLSLMQSHNYGLSPAVTQTPVSPAPLAPPPAQQLDSSTASELAAKLDPLHAPSLHSMETSADGPVGL